MGQIWKMIEMNKGMALSCSEWNLSGPNIDKSARLEVIEQPGSKFQFILSNNTKCDECDPPTRFRLRPVEINVMANKKIMELLKRFDSSTID